MELRGMIFFTGSDLYAMAAIPSSQGNKVLVPWKIIGCIFCRSMRHFVAREIVPGKFSRTLPFLPGVLQRKRCVFSALSLANRVRCIGTEEGRRAEDPFRGLRAGPARSSLSPTSAAYPKNHTQRTIPIGGSMRGCPRRCKT